MMATASRKSKHNLTARGRRGEEGLDKAASGFITGADKGQYGCRESENGKQWR